MDEVGFAGLGRMGGPMARHLVAAGHGVVGLDPGLSSAGRAELASAGVQVGDDVAALAAAPVSISMLPDAETTRQLLLGDDAGAGGLLAAAGPGHVHVVMGTVGPAAVRDLADAAAGHGVLLADAPVSGSVALAESRGLTAMVGAAPEVFAAVRPVLAAMTRAQIHTGPVGSGSTAKLAVNLVLGALNQAVAEALQVAGADGVDPEVFYDLLEASAVAAPFVGYKRAAFLDPASAGVAFPLSLLRKDVGLGLDLADQHDLELPLARTVGRLLELAPGHGLDDRDMAEVATLLRLAPSTGPQVEDTIRALEDRRYAAMVAGDLDVLGDLLSDDVSYTHSNAAVDSKASYLELMRTGGLVYLSLENVTEAVLLRPGTAVVRGTMVGRIRMHGAERTLDSRVVAVWVEGPTGWQLLAFHPTPRPAAAPG
jgi:3-hydroxyisobutyrate dehydrogenase-like beta-hydroxyacid dehydrogenase